MEILVNVLSCKKGQQNFNNIGTQPTTPSTETTVELSQMNASGGGSYIYHLPETPVPRPTGDGRVRRVVNAAESKKKAVRDCVTFIFAFFLVFIYFIFPFSGYIISALSSFLARNVDGLWFFDLILRLLLYFPGVFSLLWPLDLCVRKGKEPGSLMKFLTMVACFFCLGLYAFLFCSTTMGDVRRKPALAWARFAIEIIVALNVLIYLIVYRVKYIIIQNRTFSEPVLSGL